MTTLTRHLAFVFSFFGMLAAATIFMLSFVVEKQAFTPLFDGLVVGTWAFATVLAFATNVAKFWLVILSHAAGVLGGGRMQLGRWIAALLLISLSLFGSLLVVASRTYDPGIEAELSKRQKHIDRTYSDRSLDESSQLRRSVERVEQRYGDQRQQMIATYQPDVDKYEALRLKEMDNVVGGSYIGSRYRDYERREQAAKKVLMDKLDQLNVQERSEVKGLHNESRQQQAAFMQQRDSALAKLTHESLAGTAAVQEPSIRAVVQLVNRFSSRPIDGLDLAFFIAVLIALVVELVPLVLLLFSSRLLFAALLKKPQQRSSSDDLDPDLSLHVEPDQVAATARSRGLRAAA